MIWIGPSLGESETVSVDNGPEMYTQGSKE